MSDLEEKVKKSTEVEAVLDRALEVYQDRLGFSIKRVRGNGYWMNSAVFWHLSPDIVFVGIMFLGHVHFVPPDRSYYHSNS